MNGTSISVMIYVSDGIETSSQQILITITSDFSPELLNQIPDVSFNEDTVLENAFILSDYFYDPEGDTLVYITNGEFIIITINNDLTVDFSASENWYGAEIITIRATDPYGALAEGGISVVVVPVNDPPTINSIPIQEKDEGDHWVLDLANYITDVDNNVSELMINVESEVGQDYVKLVGSVLIFQYPKGVYSDEVRITVSDGEHEMNLNINVSLKKSLSVTPSIWDMVAWPWLILVSLIFSCSALIIYKKKSKYYVHEAFLIHETIVSGMLTAVQDFINDTLSGRTYDDWKLDEMKFSDGKILLEKSKNIYIAAIFEGNGNKLRTRVKKLLHDINKKYGEMLNDWNGNMSELDGIKAITMSLISKKGTVLKEHTDQLDIKGGKLSEHVKTEEIEEYVCPMCEAEISIEDTKCPSCDVEFDETLDSPTSSPPIPESNELEEKLD
jgi:hypothetical protein